MEKQTITYPYESDIFGLVEIQVEYTVRLEGPNEHDAEFVVDIVSTDWGLDRVTPLLSDLGTELITDYIKENL